MQPDRRLIYLMSVGFRRLQRGMEQHMLAGQNLSAAQAGVLFVLGQKDGALIGEVADALDLVPSAMTGLATRMERAGFIRRKRDDQDSRALRLYLTPAGRDARKHATARAQGLNAKLIEGFLDAEIDVVSRWLTSLQRKFPKDTEQSQTE
jgi:DNA-binding MarR family transcriptional regulator